MLKKFLKFLRSGGPNAESVDGSYLDRLLGSVHPVVERELQACPDHDPLLVLVLTILSATMPNRWDGVLPCPLSDTQSPPLMPREGDGLGEESSVIETTQIDRAAEDESGREDGSIGAAEGSRSVEGPMESGETSSIVTQRGERVEEASQEDVSEEGATDGSASASIELLANEVEHVGLGEQSAVDPSIMPEPAEDADEFGLDNPAVIQAARVFLGMLIENDRSPVPLQMSEAEAAGARDLLMSYFLGAPDFEERARALLKVVEGKFSEGAFSQARILLQLFQADRKTQVTNARNLFYEDRILCMGSRRTRAPDASALEDAVDPDLGRSASLLRKHLGVELHVCARDARQVDIWRELASHSRRQNAAEYLLRYLPPRRWRPVDSFPKSPTEMIHAHICKTTLRAYVIRHFKAAYFVLRAVGDTGLEPYLDTFFDWSIETFGVDAVQLMPMVYRRTIGEQQTVPQIFGGLYETFYADKVMAYLRKLDKGEVDDAIDAAVSRLLQVDYTKVVPGHYDAGGLVYDELLAVEYPDPAFRFKLHRLT